MTGRLFLAAAVLLGCVAVTACTPGTPYHRNAPDAAACRAYATAVVQGTPLANIDAISAGAYAQSGDLGNLITTAYERYGARFAPVDWCNKHGYPEHPLGLDE